MKVEEIKRFSLIDLGRKRQRLRCSVTVSTTNTDRGASGGRRGHVTVTVMCETGLNESNAPESL